MPFPDLSDVATLADPSAPVQASNAQMLVETGNADASVLQDAAPVPTIGGFPAGLAPRPPEDAAMLGLPAHLTQPGNTFVPPPDEREPDGSNMNIADRDSAETAPDAETRALMTSLPVEPPPSPPERQPNRAQRRSARRARKLSRQQTDRGEKYAKIYQLDLAQEGYQQAVEDDGLIWKVACKTGTLALSPGPGQIAVDEPLVIDKALFDDMLLSLQEKALPYCTVPETHANGSLENTGYVRDALILSHAEALESDKLSEKCQEAIKDDPEDTFYLLAGIDFTHPPAKEKALNGSIPDTSIGVKFNWRNTRTGKAFRAVWEHLALTPMPWIDGLPAFGMSADRWDKGIGSQKFDAVYIDSPALDLGMTVRQEGTFNEAQARSAIAGLQPGDEWSWNYGICVQVVPVGDEHIYMFRPGYDFDSYGPGDDSRKVQGFKTLDELMPFVNAAVAAEEARRAAERARYAKSEARHYGQEREAEGVNLAISFDPNKHPRDWRGRFLEVVDNLKPNEGVELPGGITVRREDPEEGKTTFVVEENGREVRSTAKFDDAADEALQHVIDDPNIDTSKLSESGEEDPDDDDTGHELSPDSVAAVHGLEIGDTVTVSGIGKAKLVGVVPQKLRDGKHPRAGNPIIERTVAAPGDKTRTVTENDHTWFELDLLEDHNLSQDAPSGDEPDLTLSRTGGGVDHRASREPNQENSHTMSKTVEELLASQQAELEAAQVEIRRLTSGLQLAQGTITSQGTQLHEEAVNKRIAAAQDAGISPALCLAAKELLIGDKSRITPGAQKLDLSIQLPKPGGTEVEETKIESVSDVVEVLLSAAATSTGTDAARIAAVAGGIGSLHLAAHEDVNEAAAARKAVEENEKRRHPERFNEDGSRKAAA